MDYQKYRNVEADTEMRRSLASGELPDASKEG
jgi:uncharacterized protein YqfA (UPF0365 family)